jgi:hypothetical protein
MCMNGMNLTLGSLLLLLLLGRVTRYSSGILTATGSNTEFQVSTRSAIQWYPGSHAVYSTALRIAITT